jgi:hypothetical protein
MHKKKGDWTGLECTRQSHARVIMIITKYSPSGEEISNRGIDSQQLTGIATEFSEEFPLIAGFESREQVELDCGEKRVESRGGSGLIWHVDSGFLPRFVP